MEWINLTLLSHQWLRVSCAVELYRLAYTSFRIENKILDPVECLCKCMQNLSETPHCMAKLYGAYVIITIIHIYRARCMCGTHYSTCEVETGACLMSNDIIIHRTFVMKYVKLQSANVIWGFIAFPVPNDQPEWYEKSWTVLDLYL